MISSCDLKEMCHEIFLKIASYFLSRILTEVRLFIHIHLYVAFMFLVTFRVRYIFCLGHISGTNFKKVICRAIFD